MIWIALVLLGALSAAADEPKRWQELTYPPPIVGSPPQLQQQIELFGTYFSGSQGHAIAPATELSYIATPALGLSAYVPYQSGSSGQPSGLRDSSFYVQFLAAGSLKHDNMLSAGIQTTFPTGADHLSSGDYLVGPFAYGAQRFWKRLTLEANVTAIYPLLHSETAKEILLDGLVSYLTTPAQSSFPIYAQGEVTSAFNFPNSSSTHTLFIAPEILLGPMVSPISKSTTLSAGFFYNLSGDSIHQRSYTVTLTFDIPNRFGY